MGRGRVERSDFKPNKLVTLLKAKGHHPDNLGLVTPSGFVEKTEKQIERESWV